MSARYSQEFKLTALTMLDQGATISDVCTGLGADSPDRSTVFRWYQQHQETGQHRPATQRREKTSANTIGLVVANILVRNATPRDTAAAYDVHAESARRWSKRYRPDPDTVESPTSLPWQRRQWSL